MAADVISREGPIMESVLVQRIARAHGFQRSGPRIQEIIQSVVEEKFRQSREGDRTIYWPEGADSAGFWPLRGPGQEPRSVADIPLAELASPRITMACDEGGGPKGTLIVTRDDPKGGINSLDINRLIEEVF
jgi:hypothetical protein